MEAAERAMTKWIRVAANMHLGAYELFEAQDKLPAPEFPQESFHDLLRIAFKDRFIEDANHPVLKALRGEL